jgi:hypothetical protein
MLERLDSANYKNEDEANCNVSPDEESKTNRQSVISVPS